MKKRKILFVCLLFLCFYSELAKAQRVDEIRKALLNPKTDKVLVVAHRGFWRCNAPENSLAAIDSAIQAKIDMVELDIYKTKDGHPVLLHDGTVDRTTDGKGSVSDMTLAEVKQLHLRDKEGNLTNHRIPTLEEALLKAKGNIMVNLDKAYDIFDDVYRIIEKTGTANLIVMKSDRPAGEVKRDLGAYLDKIIYMPVVGIDRPDVERYVKDYWKQLRPVAFELCYADPASNMPLKIKKILLRKSLCWYNTLWASLAGGHDDEAARKDPDKSYGVLIEEYRARILQTDDPIYLLNYLRSKGLHD